MTTVNLIPYPATISFQTRDDIDTAVKTEGILPLVNNFLKHFLPVDNLTNFTDSAHLLELEFTENYDLKCREETVKTHFQYQSCIQESNLTSSTFIDVSLAVLRHHFEALKMIQNQQQDALFRVNNILKQMTKCTEAAGLIAGKAEKMFLQSDQLAANATNALMASFSDEVEPSTSLRALKEALKFLTSDETQVEQSNETVEEQELMKKTMLEELRAVIEEKEIMLEKISLPDKSNAIHSLNALKTLLAFLNSAETSPMQIDETVKETMGEALKEAIKEKELVVETIGKMTATLGKVHTTCLNYSYFWKNMQKCCDSFAKEPFLFAEAEFIDEFTNELKESGLKWLAFAKANHTVLLATQELNKSGQTINDPCAEQESTHLIEAFCSAALTDIEVGH